MALPLQILFKVFSSMKIFNFLQGLMGFGNLRFAEIKSCPSASPTYELRKVGISTNIKLLTFPITLYPRYNPILFKTSILKVIFQTTVGEKNIKKTNILLFSADIHTYKLTFVSFFLRFFLHLPLTHGMEYLDKLIFLKNVVYCSVTHLCSI